MIDLNKLLSELTNKGYTYFEGSSIINKGKHIVHLFSSTSFGGRGNSIDFEISETTTEMNIYIQDSGKQVQHKNLLDVEVFDIINQLIKKEHRLQLIPLTQDAVNHLKDLESKRNDMQPLSEPDGVDDGDIVEDVPDQYWKTNTPKVGDIIKNRVNILGNDAGSIGIVYETYMDFDDNNKVAISVIFENGNYDGFSYKEMNSMLTYHGFEKNVADYHFSNVRKVDTDFRNGYWDWVFKTNKK